MGFFDRFKKKQENESTPKSEKEIEKTVDTAASGLTPNQRMSEDHSAEDRNSEYRNDAPDSGSSDSDSENAGRQPEEETEAAVKPLSPEQIYMETLTRCLGPARVRQLLFGELVVADKNWNVDFSDGVILFGFSSYPIQFLGSESYSSNTWLWGVENINGFPDSILVQTNRFFHEKSAKLAPVLHQTKVALDETVNGHYISSIVTATAEEPVCYYRCPYEGGAAYVLVQNLPSAVFETPSPVIVSKALREIISQVPVNHWLLTKSTLESCCSSVDVQTDRISGTLPGYGAFLVEFDLVGRIAKMHFDNL